MYVKGIIIQILFDLVKIKMNFQKHKKKMKILRIFLNGKWFVQLEVGFYIKTKKSKIFILIIILVHSNSIIYFIKYLNIVGVGWVPKSRWPIPT